MTQTIAEIDCPTRRKIVSSLVCHTCANHIKVLFRGEAPPELQCARWDWDAEEGRGAVETEAARDCGC